MIRSKRAYDAATPDDGVRVLVDRLWPRGVSKERLQLAQWAKDAAPSTEIREWFHHQSEDWNAFRRRYEAELEAHPETWEGLLSAARTGTLTLIYGARNKEQNNAVVLQEFLDSRLDEGGPTS